MNEYKTIKTYLIKSKKRNSIFRGVYRDFIEANADLAKLKVNDPDADWKLEERFEQVRVSGSGKKSPEEDKYKDF